MSQNQNKQHLQQHQQQLEHHQLQQQQQHHHHQQQLLHHHHQQQQQQHQQRQWGGNGMPGMFGNGLGRGGCLYEANSGSLVSGSRGVGVGVGGFDLDMASRHVGSGNASSIAPTSVVAPVVSMSVTSAVGGGFMPTHVNVSSVAGGAYNAGMSGISVASESGRRSSAGGCAYTQQPQQAQPRQQQQQQPLSQQQHQLRQQPQQQQQHAILPPERIKMEPLEQILTPTIQMEELIIKSK
ncbi:PREDICTED: AT-rich binding protein-like [Rhagoletis zephyria]|uniref:AT-rich binding protein-like n=1 Tax=Rhagoletis zephyria TaxID=28612 RepID=UPI0008115BC4|nr:PREDICTED: AT-rich binding protein-like [Rhagoletis zephyria]